MLWSESKCRRPAVFPKNNSTSQNPAAATITFVPSELTMHGRRTNDGDIVAPDDNNREKFRSVATIRVVDHLGRPVNNRNIIFSIADVNGRRVGGAIGVAQQPNEYRRAGNAANGLTDANGETQALLQFFSPGLWFVQAQDVTASDNNFSYLKQASFRTHFVEVPKDQQKSDDKKVTKPGPAQVCGFEKPIECRTKAFPYHGEHVTPDVSLRIPPYQTGRPPQHPSCFSLRGANW